MDDPTTSSDIQADVYLRGGGAENYRLPTGRLDTATYPNGQTTTYSYLGNTGDQRLQTIHHRKSDTSTLSKFDYTYDAIGNIRSWSQQADNAAATMYTFGYDAADQLTAATNQTTDLTPTVLKRFAYTYDAAGNRSSEQIDDSITSGTHNSLNRLTGQTVGGALRFAGTINEPGTVTIQGRAAKVEADNRFSGSAPVTTGTTIITIAATDASGNNSEKAYEVGQAGTGRTLAYDANGNMTANGTRTFEWDAENRLVAVNIGTHRSEFIYDGLDRRVRIVEKENGGTVRDANLFWDGTEIIDERLATGETNRFFSDGEQLNGAARYLTRDHLGSIREVTDAAGTVVTRNDYDPYGRLTRTGGTEDSHFGFTGHYVHSPSGLVLALYRAYDPALGRWLSEDPIGLAGGVNLHTYVRGNSINLLDPLGLWNFKPGTPINTLKPPMPSIEGRVDDAFQQIAGRDGVVTATTNGQHKQGSLHGKGLAVDLRGRDLTDAQSKKVRDILKKNLGPDYDVLWETSPKNRDNNHIHVEYDPKNKPTGTSGERCP